MSARRISAEALELLKRWEGCVLHAYDDADPTRPPRLVQPGDPVRGTLTIGYGHTRTVQPGQRISEAQAERLLLDDLCGSAWKKDPLGGVIGVQKGPLC